MGGISLPALLRAEAALKAGGAGSPQRHKSVIMIYLTGGPPHQDMVDLKPDAPSDVRGEFRPIETNVSGIQVSELMPRLARSMDRFAIVRSLVGSAGRHNSMQCVTGHGPRVQPAGGWPELGAVMSKLQGMAVPGMPPAVDLSLEMAHKPYNLPGSGFLGTAHAPFQPRGRAMDDMVLQGVDLERLADRRTLVSGLDRFRRNVDQGLPGGLDTFTEQAFEVLTSSGLVEALDLEREDPRVRERYGQDDEKVLSYSHLGYKAVMSKFLAARRLVEAGARCVTVAFADFDWHGANFARARSVVPLLDQGVTALVDDLHQRGLDEDVAVVVWGEFGRTPKINKGAGRDHWPNVACALLAGGGFRTGQVVGATDRLAAEAAERPVHFQEVFATLYQHLGIDAQRTTVTDLTGRPHYLVDAEYEPIRELT